MAAPAKKKQNNKQDKEAKGEEPQGGLPRNYLRASLLLLIGEAPAHGYDLLDHIGQLGLRSVDPGGLYRTLRVMEDDGLVSSWWEHSVAGPARRTYALTHEGVEWLHAWAGALRESHRYLSAYLGRYDSISEPVTMASAKASKAGASS
ncbi:MAG TPA: helix-turn-helix transcriptional regulator [Acidimicrobiales bacterium]|nr:helix-turn-helix transcriptional regulator [Acidimicrobiales bacterium]